MIRLNNNIEMLIHGPVKDCVKDTWKVMDDYVCQGKVKSIGVRNLRSNVLNDPETFPW